MGAVLLLSKKLIYESLSISHFKANIRFRTKPRDVAIVFKKDQLFPKVFLPAFLWFYKGAILVLTLTYIR